MVKRPRQTRCSEPWPPPELRLPNTIEEIERGRIDQQRLFPKSVDDTRECRLARLTGSATAKPAPQDSRGCVPGGMVDT